MDRNAVDQAALIQIIGQTANTYQRECDFPPVASREGYSSALRLCQEQFAAKPESARAAIFGGTAARIFRLPQV
jgi:hypothetical protein